MQTPQAYTNTNRQTQTHRQTGKYRHKEANTDTDRHIDTQAYTNTNRQTQTHRHTGKYRHIDREIYRTCPDVSSRFFQTVCGMKTLPVSSGRELLWIVKTETHFHQSCSHAYVHTADRRPFCTCQQRLLISSVQQTDHKCQKFTKDTSAL